MHSSLTGRTTHRRAAFAYAVAFLLVASAVVLAARGGQGQEVQPTTGIILSASPANLSEGASSVAFTITARWASGTGDITNRTINYTITLPSGVTANPNTLTGTVTIASGQVNGSSTHTSLALSNLDNNAVDNPARNITISGSVAAAPSIPVHSATVPIVDNDGTTVPPTTTGTTAPPTTTGTTAPPTTTGTTAPPPAATATTAPAAPSTAPPPPTLAEVLPDWSACIGPARRATKFTDVAGWDSNPAIRCAAYYGITKGRTPTRFAPAERVPRWQMALFLYRASGPAGVELPEATDQGFTDIDSLTEEVQNAANTLSAIGIMPGAAEGMFDPQGLISRRSMAVILHGFLQRATLQKGVTISGGTTGFTDLDSLSPQERRAVARLFALGVVRGTTAGTFAPDNPVTRGQMVQFITRALAYTIVRPAGITLQADRATAVGRSVDVVVSVRDESFLPTAGARIDMLTSFTAGDLFADDGACLPGVFFRLAGGQACLLDPADPLTDQNGDLRLRVHEVRAGQRVLAWTGAVGDELTGLVRLGRITFTL